MAKINIRAVGIDHVVLNVRNVEASKAFYMDVLGFTFRGEHDSSRSPMAFLAAGSQGLDLAEVPEGDLHGGVEMNHMALRVAEGEREEIVAQLAELGIVVEGRPSDPRTMYFSDPDGHRIQLLSVSEQKAADAEHDEHVPA